MGMYKTFLISAIPSNNVAPLSPTPWFFSLQADTDNETPDSIELNSIALSTLPFADNGNA